MPFRMGPWELGLILIIFGVGKLLQVGNAIGKGMPSSIRDSTAKMIFDMGRAIGLSEPRRRAKTAK